MKKIIMIIALFLGLVLFLGDNKAQAAVTARYQNSKYQYTAVGNVTGTTIRIHKLMTPLRHKQVVGDSRLDETIGANLAVSAQFTMSGDKGLNVGSEILGGQLLASIGCAASVSGTASKSYVKNIYRDDPTGLYWFEAYCPASSLKVTAGKIKRSTGKLVSSSSLTLKYAPKINKIAYRFRYSPN